MDPSVVRLASNGRNGEREKGRRYFLYLLVKHAETEPSDVSCFSSVLVNVGKHGGKRLCNLPVSDYVSLLLYFLYFTRTCIWVVLYNIPNRITFIQILRAWCGMDLWECKKTRHSQSLNRRKPLLGVISQFLKWNIIHNQVKSVKPYQEICIDC